jgi:hypothetical protein
VGGSRRSKVEMKGRSVASAVVALTLAATAGTANAATVRAAEPQTLVDALRSGGYTATLTRDDTGDPLINLELAGWKAILVFYDCAATHDQCQSVQFRSTFDAEGAGMSAADALRFASEQRFANVTLNRSSDPVLSWDVVTGSGIPDDVFLLGTQRFLDALKAMGARLYG